MNIQFELLPFFSITESDTEKETGSIDLSFEVRKFSPEIAKTLIERDKKHNRPLSATRIKEYTHSMRIGEWLIAEPLLFDEDGNLIDGFHRLTAVVKSGRDVIFTIIKGVPKDAKAVIDQGKPRSSSDIAVMSGLRHIKPLHMSTVNAMHLSRGKETPKLSNKRRTELYIAHSEAVNFVIDHMPSKSPLRLAKFTSAIAKAWYYEDPSRLIDFMNKTFSMIAKDESEAQPAKLSQKYISATKKEKRGGQLDWFRMAERSVFEFCSGGEVVGKYGDRVYYPLPAFDVESAYNTARYSEIRHDIEIDL